MGRARTDRTVQRVVRLSLDEDKIVSENAQELGLTPASFLRLASIKKLPRRSGMLDIEIQKDMWRQISGMARNINQLSKYAHTGMLKPGELEGATSDIRELMRRVMEMYGR
jgi:hypothetical protein